MCIRDSRHDFPFLRVLRTGTSLGVRVPGGAREGTVGFPEALVLGRVGMDERGDLAGESLPRADELSLADLLAHACACLLYTSRCV